MYQTNIKGRACHLHVTSWLKDIYSNVMIKIVVIIMPILGTLVCLRDIIWVRYDNDHNAHHNRQFVLVEGNWVSIRTCMDTKFRLWLCIMNNKINLTLTLTLTLSFS